MRAIFHKRFQKRYEKLRRGEKHSTQERIRLFYESPFHPLLDNHALQGEYKGYRSINVTGDLRAIYEEINSDTVHFTKLGTHPELYE
ncbi:MAG: type II toxin-antitoxin system mRNA interferase toxin, RelE/StbE family [Candidatus Sungbacteria bacterium]|nr:type II toxin-antitoxin system mRNA interferase toxin, RelE/StbE family [Candidatus Sungbacteria bacterium]